MVKVDVICVKILTVEDLFYLKPFPCSQEPSNLESWAQKVERVCEDNDFEVLDSRHEINIHALQIYEFKLEVLGMT